jgi:hypothetical protein
MYVTYTRHRVKDHNAWKKAFDDNASMLADNGIAWEIVTVEGDPTDVVILCRCPDKAAWEAFMKAGEEKMQRSGENPAEKGGVVGDIEWWGGEVV